MLHPPPSFTECPGASLAARFSTVIRTQLMYRYISVLYCLTFDRPCNNLLDQAARADQNPQWKFDSAASRTLDCRVYIHMQESEVMNN